MASIITALALCADVGFLASASRMVWSFARDRGLPGWKFLSRVCSSSTEDTTLEFKRESGFSNFETPGRTSYIRPRVGNRHYNFYIRGSIPHSHRLDTCLQHHCLAYRGLSVPQLSDRNFSHPLPALHRRRLLCFGLSCYGHEYCGHTPGLGSLAFPGSSRNIHQLLCLPLSDSDPFLQLLANIRPNRCCRYELFERIDGRSGCFQHILLRGIRPETLQRADC